MTQTCLREKWFTPHFLEFHVAERVERKELSL